MPIAADKRRIQAVIESDLAEKIQHLAKRMDVSESACIAMLLDVAVENESWMIKAVTSRFGKKVGKLLGIIGKDRDRFIEDNAELDGASNA